MTDQTNKLEPCPFCGGKAYIDQHGTRRQSCVISCHTCGCMLETNEEGANCGDQWNRRASAPTAGSVPSDLTAEHIDRFEASLSDLGPATRQAAALVCALAKSALLAQYGGAAWQPIETAPHETNVLLSWVDWDGKWQFEVGQASWGWSTPAVSNRSCHGRATHWMPLPPAPQEGK